MPGTYSQILLHVVFSTKGRARVIKPELQSRLYGYIGGIIRAEKGTLYAIGGMPDHVHLLLRWRTDGTIADLMRTGQVPVLPLAASDVPCVCCTCVAGGIRGVLRQQVRRGKGQNVH